MLTFILGFLLGVFVTFVTIVGYCAFHYYSAMHEAIQEGWEIPN